MARNRSCPKLVEDFIHTQVISRGLDVRTAIAYRMDLEKFYMWLDAPGVPEGAVGIPKETNREAQMENWMEAYLEYLSTEKGLRYSTISRKQKVFGYYLSYLVSRGIQKDHRLLKPVSHSQEDSIDTLLTKKEVEAFFHAIDREYEELDSDFRRRICLRDQVMMKLLFYHGIDISELLQLELSDYNQKTATLVIHRRRQADYSVYLFSRVLQQQMDQWLSEHVYFEHGGVYHNCMFLSKLGKPLSMKMVINIFDKYRELAGIEKMCKPKDLKNSLGRYAEEVVRELAWALDWEKEMNRI